MNSIIQALNDHKLFLITSHVAPDGDQVGSCIALVKYLQQMGKEAYYVLDDLLPSNLSFLYEGMKIYESQEILPVLSDREYVMIALDCGNKERLKIENKLIQGATLLLNIDHHESNDDFGDFNYVVKEASSTCELMYDLMTAIDEQWINPEIATAIYTGLSTDTGNFKYESARSSTFRVAAALIDLGAHKDTVVRNIYQNDSYNYVKMVAAATSGLVKEENIAYMTLEKQLLEKYQVDFKDLEELPAATVSIQGVEIGLLFKEKEEQTIKVSFRSKEWANVNHIAGAFGGGGHARAAGCTINATMDQAVAMVLEKTREYITIHGRNTKYS